MKNIIDKALSVFKWQTLSNVDRVEKTFGGWAVYFKDGDVCYIY